MARIRSIHPGIYTDEAWASVSVAARWLGIGLCTEADDNGVFEWKPLQIKMRIFPADTIDVGGLLEELEDAGVLLRFSAEGKALGCVKNFCKYQRPRKPKAWLPITQEACIFVAQNTEAAHLDDERSAPDEEVPQKSEPIPQKSEKSPQMDDGGCIEEKKESCPKRKRVSYPDEFEAAWQAYPTSPNMSKADSFKCWQKALAFADAQQILSGIVAYRAFCGLPAQKTYSPAHMETWLNGRRWEGFTEAAKQSPTLPVVLRGTPQWEAWRQYREARGHRVTLDKITVESEWPPGYQRPVENVSIVKHSSGEAA